MNFLTTFQTTFTAVAQIFVMGTVGYLLVRRKIIDDKGLVMLSKLVISLFFPVFSFYQLITNFHFSVYPNWWIFPLVSLGITLGGFLVGGFMIKLFKGITYKKDFTAVVGFQNSGFIPLMLAATMFSGPMAQELYIYIFLFLIGFDLVLWSFGVWFLTRHKVNKFDLKNLFLSPFTAIVISLILVALGIDRFIPQAVMKPIKMFGDCALPLAVMTVGGNLALIDIFAVNKKEIALAVFSKLVFLPLLALLVILAFGIRGPVGFLIMMQAAVPSANSLSVISRRHQIEDKFLNQGVLFTNLFSIFTLPVFLTLYMQLGLF